MAARKSAGAGTKTRAKALDARTARISSADGLSNALVGMGGASVRRAGDHYTFAKTDPHQLETMYRSDWMCRKAVDIPADDMTQEWREWQASDRQITALENAEKDLQLKTAVKTALKYSRLYGGGAVIAYTADNAAMPLTADKLPRGGLKRVIPVAGHNLTPDGEICWDPAKDFYGQAEYYQLTLGNANQAKVHYSRVTRFVGAPYPDPAREADVWGDSILDALRDAVRDAAASNSAGAQLIEEAKVDIVQMENLEQYLGDQKSTDMLSRRMELLKLGKGLYRILLMGGKEKYDSKNFSLANVDKVLYYFMQVVSGATDIPATRFLSQSPAGMNATGESDLRNYAQTINALQEDRLRPAMRSLDDLLVKHALGSKRTDKIWYDYPTIWKMSLKELAEINKMNAEADTAYANSGMIPIIALEQSIQTRMESSGMYPGLAAAIAKLKPDELEEKRPAPAEIPLDPNKQPKPGEEDDDKGPVVE